MATAASAHPSDHREPGGHVAVVDKVARVLRAFSPSASRLSVRQVSERTGIPRSTVHALCSSLTAAGLLEAVPDAGVRRGGYRLGPLLLELGGQVIDRSGLVTAFEESAGPLCSGAGQEVHLGQLAGGWTVYLHRRAGDRPVPMHNRVGLRAPAHLTGCGKAVLAHLPWEDVQTRVASWCEATGSAPPDLVGLGEDLRTARATGWLVSRSYQQGRTSVAVPIFDEEGRAVAGLSVAGSGPSFSASQVHRAADDLRAAAARISAAMTVRHPSTPRRAP